jgi:vacuolar-type H+-ATPase subunit I/STV1
MDLFQSEEMHKVQLIIPADSAHDTMTYLAEIGQVQFKDVRLALSVQENSASHFSSLYA